MIQKAIDIVKVRWPEVTLVVVLLATWMMFYGELTEMGQSAQDTDTQLPFFPNFLLGLGTMTMFMVCLMLWLGFLKTSSTGGEQLQQPIDLLRRGQPYFWKTLLFLIVYEFFCAFIVSLIIVFVWLSREADTATPLEEQIEGISQFVQTSRLTESLMLVSYLVFIKPLLFIPARIVVFEDTFMGALGAMRRYRIGEIPHVFKLAVGGFAVVIVCMLVSMLATEKTVVYYIFSGLYHILFSMVMLFLTLLAVLWMQGYHAAEQAQSQQEQE